MHVRSKGRLHSLEIPCCPFTQVVADTPVRDEQCTTRWEASISKVEVTVWHKQVQGPGLFKDPTVGGAALHTRKHIAKQHVEGACRQDILRDGSLPITMRCTQSFGAGLAEYVGAINGSENTTHEGEELWVVKNEGGKGRVCGWKTQIALAKVNLAECDVDVVNVAVTTSSQFLAPAT
jgi:hypothetical protein